MVLGSLAGRSVIPSVGKAITQSDAQRSLR
jgi:hypothetical protein